MKFSGLSRLVMANLGLGSTSPHHVGLGLYTVFFPGVNLLCGHGCYGVVSYHFGKHLTRQTIMWDIFDFGPISSLTGYAGADYEGSYFLKFANFQLNRPPWNQILRTFCDMQLLHRTSSWSRMASAWPLIRPCSRNASPPWSLVLMGHVVPLWKAFDMLNKHEWADFWFWASVKCIPKWYDMTR